jgi:hypothetical protein
MKLSDITPIQILGGILVVNTVLAGGTAQLTDLFGATMANHILSISILGSGICGGFIMNMGGLPSQVRNVLAMPGVEKIDVNGQASAALATLAVDPAQNKISPTPAAMDKVAATAKAAAVILVALLLSVLIAPSAFAQTPRPKLTGNIAADIAAATTKPGVALTGNIQQDLQALWQTIVTSSLADLNYAAAMAASANTTTSAIRLQCVKAIIQLNEQASGVNLKNADGTPMVKPDPHLFTDVESLAEIIDNLSPQGPLFVSCAGAAQLAKTNVLAFVNGVVTGVAGFAAMPIIPGL